MTTPAALQPQFVTIPFRAGLDKKTSEKAVKPPSLVAVENASFDSPGEIKKDSAYGLTGVALESPVYRTFGVANKRLVFARNNLYEVADVDGAAHQLNTSICGNGFACSTSAMPISDERVNFSTTVVYDGDYACVNGFELLVSSDYGAAALAHYIIRERATGAVVTNAFITDLSVGGTVRALACGVFLILLWPASSTTALKIMLYNTTGPSGSGTAALATNVSTQQCFDACVSGSGASARMFVAYHCSAGGGIRLLKVDPANPLAATSADATGNPNGGCMGIGTDGTHAVVAWCDTATGLHVASFTTAPAAASAHVENAGATSVNRIGVCSSGDGTNALIVYEDATGGPIVIQRVLSRLDGASSGTRRSLYNFNLSHKPFLVPRASSAESLCYFGIMQSEGTAASATQNFYATCVVAAADFLASSIAPVAWYLYGSAHARLNKNALPAVTLDAGEYRWMASERVDVGKKDASGVDFGQLLSLQSLRFNDGNAIALFDTVGFPGNAIRDSDGLVDLAFHFGPTILSVSFSASGGSLVNGKSYEWIAVYEMADSYGNVQRSRPSLPFAVVATNNTASVTIATPFTRKGNSVTLRLYRTQADLGPPHYACTHVFQVPQRSSVASYALSDLDSDAAIGTREQLYTDLGQLPNYPPPMGRYWCIHQNRIWAIDEHTYELRYTKTLVIGDAPAWHPILTLPLLTDRIIPKALVSSPSGLWVLGQDKSTGAGAIAIVLGDGPSDSGQGATYTVQRLEGNNVGVSSGDAFVTTPNGIMFEDDRFGIHTLSSTGGQPQPIGMLVESLRAGKTLIRPVLLQDRHEVRFVYADGFMLCYDYVVGQWFTRQLQEGEGHYSLVDTCIWNGKHVLSDGSLGVYEHGSSTLDAGAQYVPTTITTGWIGLADFEGLQRVWDLWILGTRYDAMSLQVSISYDYDDSSPDVYTFTETDLAGAAGSALELRIALRKQLATTIKVSIVDGAPAVGNTHAGYGLVALRIRYGVLERSRRARPAQVKA